MSIERLRKCVGEFARLVTAGLPEEAVIDEGKRHLAALLESDDWLPEFLAAPSEESYRQYLLYCDPLNRFSVTSFVWGPGQKTPIHNHTVWGLVGVLRGEEHSRRFEFNADGSLAGSEWEKMGPGNIDVVSPSHGDIHQVSNGLRDRTSVSIHIYGANIGLVRRSVFDPETGSSKGFISGYNNAVIPNLWYN